MCVCVFSIDVFRNNSIACLRAKAQEHQARLLNSGLLLQVRSLAGLQNTLGQSPPHSCDSNANTLLNSAHQSSHEHPATSPMESQNRSFHHHQSPTSNLSANASVKSEFNSGINMTAF